VSATIRKGSAGFVRHRMNNAQKSIRESHAGKALRIVHGIALGHIAVVGRNQILLDRHNREDREWVGIIAVCGGNISFDRVGYGVHTGVGNQLLRHGLGQIRIHDGDIRGDFKIGNRVLDTLLIVGDDGKRGHFGSRTGSGRNRAEMGLFAELGQTEHLAHILKGGLGILILDPHGLCGIDRRTAAHGNNPVRLKFLHGRRTAHNGFDGRIGLNAFKELDFHAGFLQVRNSFVQKSEALHRTAANADHRTFAFKGFQRFQRAFAVIQISR